MKAWTYGTPTEQARARQGWTSAKLREPAACRNCPKCEAEGTERGSGFPDLMRYRCTVGNFATAPGAICRLHPEYRETEKGRVL